LLAKVVPTIAQPALQKNLHAADAFQPALEILEERDVVTADHDQELDVRERQGRKGGEEQGRVPSAIAVSLGGIVEGRLLTEVAGPPLDTTRRTDDFHFAENLCLLARPGLAAYNSGKFPHGSLPGTTL
jgi:hypothetical protein